MISRCSYGIIIYDIERCINISSVLEKWARVLEKWAHRKDANVNNFVSLASCRVVSCRIVSCQVASGRVGSRRVGRVYDRGDDSDDGDDDDYDADDDDDDNNDDDNDKTIFFCRL